MIEARNELRAIQEKEAEAAAKEAEELQNQNGAFILSRPESVSDTNMMIVPDEYFDEQGNGADREEASMAGPLDTLMEAGRETILSQPVRSNSIQAPRGGLCGNGSGPDGQADKSCCLIF